MKKMLSTTLVAIAFAMVSTVDAKVMKRAGGTKAQTQTQKVDEVVAVATEIVEMPVVEVRAPAMTEVQKLLSAQNITEDEREYAVLEFQLKDTEARIAFRKAQRADLQGGLFSLYSVPADKKAEYDRLTKIINNLENDKKQISADMKKLNVSNSWAKAMKLAALGIAATMAGSIAYAIDQKAFGSQGATFMSENVVEPLKTRAGQVKAAIYQKAGYAAGK